MVLRASLFFLSLLIFVLPLLVVPAYITFFEIPRRIAIWFFSLGIFLLILVQPKFFHWPKFPRTLQLTLVGIFILYLLSMAMNWPGPYLIPLMEWLSLFSLCLFTYSLAQQEQQKTLQAILWANYFSSALCVIHTLVGFGGIQLVWFLDNTEFISLLGNANLTAQFLGLSFLLQIYFFLQLPPRPWRYLWVIYFSLSILSISLLYSRSVYISVALGLTPYFWQHAQRLKKYQRPLIVALALFLISFLAPLMGKNLLQKKAPQLLARIQKIHPLISAKKTEEKMLSTQVRLARMANTVAMIMDRPWWGVGPDNYSFAYVPYKDSFMKDIGIREKEISRSPHNAFLEAAVESGLPLLLLLLLALMLLGKRLISFSGDKVFFLSLFFYFIVEAFFSFPLELPEMSLYAAVLMGLFLSAIFPQGRPLSFPLTRALALTSLVFIAFWGQRYHLSNYYLWKHLFKLPGITKSCELFPQNWRACTHQGELEILDHDFAKAEVTLTRILKETPFSFPAIRGLGIVKLYLGDRTGGCNLLGLYSYLLDGKVSLDSQVYPYCPNIPLNVSQIENK